MMFDFDSVIDRSGTNATAIGGVRKYLLADRGDVVVPCADEDTLALWVADMSFASVPAARDAMRQRLEHPIFGYTAVYNDELFEAFIDWCRRRHGWAPELQHVVSSAGVVPALSCLVELITSPHDKVLTLTPAYGRFERVLSHSGRTLVTCALIEAADGSISVDFDAFETAVADPAVTLHFLCHPHNPTGHVWTQHELRRMGELCFENDVVIVSDEIHCDLLRHGVTHMPLARLFPQSDQIITTMAASKTFNLAGLKLALVVIPDGEIRAAWNDRNSTNVNPLSVAASVGAFRHGDQWLDELRTYLDMNFALVRNTLAEQLPEAVFQVPEATYLAWIGLGHYVDSETDLTRLFAEGAGLLIEGSDMFVADAEGHIRLNVACPRSVLQDALDRLITVVESVSSRNDDDGHAR